jgi:hypothetical protein
MGFHPFRKAQRLRIKMNTLENLLNTAVEEKGWRISPRASMEDRLVRYLTLTWQERGKELSEEDARGAAKLMILKHNGSCCDETCDERSNAWSGRTRSTSRNSSRTETNTNAWSGRTEAPGANVWSGRTRSSARPEFVEPSPSRTVSASRDGSVRVTFSSGAHPMVRRSQVNGTHSMVRRSQANHSR